MITETEITWLESNHPTLKVNTDHTEVSGDFNFTATYDSETDKFTWLTSPGQTAPGVVLSGTYKIAIKKIEDEKLLPSLKVEIDKEKLITDRHFYPSGGACLCGPAEVYEFIKQGYSFPRYFETLVVPFLYGQTYYDLYSKWPWGEYTHGAAGVFESYSRSEKTKEHAEACLRQLQKNGDWPRIKRVLSGEERITETSNCFCTKPKQIRRCHGYTWSAMLKLKKDIRDYRISLSN